LETVAVRNNIETSLLFIDFIRYHETEALLQGGDEAWAREDVQRFGASLSTNRRHRPPYLRALATQARWDGETQELAEKMGDEALRTNFLAEPAIRRVLERAQA
jgi:hypothetical protein